MIKYIDNYPKYLYSFPDAEDEVSENTCVCKDHQITQFKADCSGIDFLWADKCMNYWGEDDGKVHIRYCPFCGRRL